MRPSEHVQPPVFSIADASGRQIKRNGRGTRDHRVAMAVWWQEVGRGLAACCAKNEPFGIFWRIPIDWQRCAGGRRQGVCVCVWEGLAVWRGYHLSWARSGAKGARQVYSVCGDVDDAGRGALGSCSRCLAFGWRTRALARGQLATTDMPLTESTCILCHNRHL